MGEEGMPDGEWPSLDFDLDMGSDFDLSDLGSLEDLCLTSISRGSSKTSRGTPNPGCGIPRAAGFRDSGSDQSYHLSYRQRYRAAKTGV